MKIKGISIWIWLLGFCVISGIGTVVWSKAQGPKEPIKIEVIKDDVWENSKGWEVRGQIHNPRKEEARNLTVTYELKGIGMKSDIGKPIGTVSANIRYIPAGGTVDFVAMGYHRKDRWAVVDMGAAIITEDVVKK